MPDPEHQLHVIGTILRRDGNAVAGLKRKTVTQRRRELCSSPSDLVVTPNDARAQSQGGPVPMTCSCTFKPKRKIHDALRCLCGKGAAPYRQKNTRSFMTRAFATVTALVFGLRKL